MTTVAGAFDRYTSADGPAASAGLFGIVGVALDAAGNVVLTDCSGTIRRLSASGIVSTFAGQAGMRGTIGGAGASARFTNPRGPAIDAAANLFVADASDRVIRRVDGAANVTTVVGVADRVGGMRLGPLPGHLDGPPDLAVGSMGTLFVTDDRAVLRVILRWPRRPGARRGRRGSRGIIDGPVSRGAPLSSRRIDART